MLAVIGEQVTDEGLTVAQIARRAGVPEPVAQGWIDGVTRRDGKRVRMAPAFRLGGDEWRVKADDVDAWVRENIDPAFVPLVVEAPAPDALDSRRGELTAELARLEAHKAGLADQLAELRARVLLRDDADRDRPDVANRLSRFFGDE